jgi:hypothetical protein
MHLTAVRSSTITLPLEWNKVGQVVVEAHAVAGRVAPVVHLATPGIWQECWLAKLGQKLE